MDMPGWIQGDISLYSWNCSHLFTSRLLSLVQRLPASCQPIMPTPHKKFNMLLLIEIFRSFTLTHYTGYGFARISQEAQDENYSSQQHFMHKTTAKIRRADDICSPYLFSAKITSATNEKVLPFCTALTQVFLGESTAFLNSSNTSFLGRKRLANSLSRDAYQGIRTKVERMRKYLGSKKLLY